MNDELHGMFAYWDDTWRNIKKKNACIGFKKIVKSAGQDNVHVLNDFVYGVSSAGPDYVLNEFFKHGVSVNHFWRFCLYFLIKC